VTWGGSITEWKEKVESTHLSRKSLGLGSDMVGVWLGKYYVNHYHEVQVNSTKNKQVNTSVRIKNNQEKKNYKVNGVQENKFS